MKKWYQSKTIWLNAITMAVALLATLQTGLAEIAPGMVPAIGASIAGLNLVLRFVTTKAIR